MPVTDALCLLERLKVPVRRDYGPEELVNLATLEAAIFRDMWIQEDVDSDTIRLYQLQAAIDYGVLDRAALQKKLRQFTAEIFKIHVRHDDPEDSPDPDGAWNEELTRTGQKRDRPESG